MLTFKEIKKNPEIKTYIEKSNEILGTAGFTEHGAAHSVRTATVAAEILEKLGFSERVCELTAIAGYMHDIGNIVNRSGHAHSGAVMVFNILHRLGMNPDEIADITAAIGHHDEKTAGAVNPLAAAVILADKSDVRRTRVRTKNSLLSDIHDRVNYAVHDSKLVLEQDSKLLILKLKVDTEICPVMEYFEIFLDRMVLCKKAADYLGLNFELIINDTRLL